MVGTRMYRRLLSHAAQANVKAVLVGDERQLPSIAAGGALEGLADRLGSIELTEVHRQNEVWDRQALDELRHGDISQWVAAYERHGRLVSTAGPDEQARALVEDWYVASRRDGMDQTLMLAGRRHDVEALNQLARAARVAAGELDDTAALEVGDRLFTVGDRVMALRNTHVARADEAGNVPLRNGNRGTVTEIDHLADSLGVRLDNDTEVVLDADYLQDGHLAHGYALTIHKSQGATVRQTFVLASPDLARELGYVASSRHTDEARFYINNGSEGGRDRPPEPGLEDQPLYEELERTPVTSGRRRSRSTKPRPTPNSASCPPQSCWRFQNAADEHWPRSPARRGAPRTSSCSNAPQAAWRRANSASMPPARSSPDSADVSGGSVLRSSSASGARGLTRDRTQGARRADRQGRRREHRPMGRSPRDGARRGDRRRP